MFKSRVALAATLSGNYGIYNGFELLEHEPIPGREEYLNSEKYEIKVRDWNKPGNIKPYIARAEPRPARQRGAAADQQSALPAQSTTATSSASSRNRSMADNAVAVAIALTRDGPRSSGCRFGDIEIGIGRRSAAVSRAVENLVTGERHAVEWGGVRLRIDPARDPALLFRCLA